MKPDLASTLPVHDHAAKPESSGCGGCCGHSHPAAKDTAHDAHDHDHNHDHGHEHGAVAPIDAATLARAKGRTTVRIEQMDCPT